MSWRHHLLLPLLVAPVVAVVEDVFVVMGLLPDTQNCGLRMRQECRERFPRHRLQRKPRVSDPDMHHGTCLTHVPWCMSGSPTCYGGGKRSRHSRHMHNPEFYVSGKRPIGGCHMGIMASKNKETTTAPHYWPFVRWIHWSPLLKNVSMSLCHQVSPPWEMNNTQFISAK